ncbi:hypothetical protein DUI87_10539 [Hirundo rustica rustica]|uniref:Uncharacterized protein n=1 Tax=Hirundo rustica rustica TaxID=333673 RepID=A0A3M0KQ58_HIRRU|nr:hypothetical protein DUI87_10539 [Hirundo rustica rustica]
MVWTCISLWVPMGCTHDTHDVIARPLWINFDQSRRLQEIPEDCRKSKCYSSLEEGQGGSRELQASHSHRDRWKGSGIGNPENYFQAHEQENHMECPAWLQQVKFMFDQIDTFSSDISGHGAAEGANSHNTSHIYFWASLLAWICWRTSRNLSKNFEVPPAAGRLGTPSLFLGLVGWDSCLDTDEEHVNFAKSDELNRAHSENREEPDGPLKFELDICHQDPEYKSPAPLPHAQVKLITSWEAGWNVTNAIQVSGGLNTEKSQPPLYRKASDDFQYYDS